MSMISLLVVTLLLGILAVVVLRGVGGTAGDCPHGHATTTTIIPGVTAKSLGLQGC